MSASDRIRQRREELGMTQDELAKKLGYKSRSSVNKVENSRDLPIKKVKEFASVLDCSPSYLMGWEDTIQIEYEKGYNPDVILSYGAKIGEMAKDTELMQYANKISALPHDKQKQIYAYIDFIVSQTPLETLV